jgi:hypothetical protein
MVASNGRTSAVTGVDHTETIAIGIGEHDEVGVVRVTVPVDPLGAQGHQPLDLGGLVGRVPGVQVKMDPRMLLDRRLAEAERQPDPAPRAGTSTTQSSSISSRGTYPRASIQNAAARATSQTPRTTDPMLSMR